MLVCLLDYMETRIPWLHCPQVVYMLALVGCVFPAPLDYLVKANVSNLNQVSSRSELSQEGHRIIRQSSQSMVQAAVISLPQYLEYLRSVSVGSNWLRKPLPGGRQTYDTSAVGGFRSVWAFSNGC